MKKEEIQAQIETLQKKLKDIEKSETKKSLLDITERVKSFEDACEVLGIEKRSFDNLFKYEIDSYKLQTIIKALNEGWVPNWSDTNEKKWFPYFNMNDSNASGGVSFADTDYFDWDTYSCVCSRFCLKNEKLALYVGVTFIDLYREMMVIE
jgi:hypothetical protein